MFEAAELGNAVAKADHDARLPALRVDLVNAQYDLRGADFPVIVVLTGDDRAGVNEVLNVLHEWMDARWIRTHPFRPPSESDRARPRLARYWGTLPGKGRLAIVIGDWTTQLLAEHLFGELPDAAFERALEHALRFERTLVDDGALLLKFWLHLPKKELKKRLKRARRADVGALRVDALDRRLYSLYDELLPVAARVLRHTSTAGAPWHVVEGSDAAYRNLTVAEGILAAIRRRLAAPPAAPAPTVAIPELDPGTTVLGSVDLDAKLAYDAYKERLLAAQARLRKLGRRARQKGVTTLLLFEGWDAAGKGGAIRRITQALDARDYRVVPVAVPSEEERAHHYLWRFWRELPEAGGLVIFDRSWYGRVLVERVEGLAREDEWRRAYAEINDFEEQIALSGALLCKFWLHLDPAEQLRRFEAREKTPYKKYKIGDDDYRNRGRWEEYVAAVDEMVARTSTELAPWHLVPATDKRFARVQVLELACRALARAIDRN